MLIYFDKEDLQLQIKVGSLEEYTPTPEIKELVRRADALKTKRDLFIANEFEPEMKALLDIVDRINITANPQLKALRDQQAQAATP